MDNKFSTYPVPLVLFLITFFSGAEASDYGVLASESSTEKENFCIIYFKEFLALPPTKSQAYFHLLQDQTGIDWCDDHPGDDIRSKVLLVRNGNCSISKQARNIYDKGGEGILFVTSSKTANGIKVNASTAEGINISVALISEKSAQKLKTMHPRVSVCFFAPTKESFDFSLLFIFIISMVTVFIGSYWSGLIRFAIYCKEMDNVPEGNTHELPNKPYKNIKINEESSLNVSPFAVGGFVTCMVLMLVLLYFFFSYLVYFIIGIFVIASIMSIHGCLEFLVLKIELSFCKARFQCGTRTCNLDFRQVLLVCFAIAISLYWFVTRKDKYSWILQDILGVAFCIQMLKTIRLPSFKICTVLLVLLFFYDIFFVFVTPYLTGKSESVMEEVATGGKSEETLPMIFKVPHLGFDPLAVCYQQYSLLGFGDVLVPGVVISYCHGFDLMTNKRRIYFFTTVIMYAVGLFVTSVSLLFMNTAQPALLYLVPCTLIPAAFLAYCRKEFYALWIGFRVTKQKNPPTQPEVQNEENGLSSEPTDNSNLSSNLVNTAAHVSETESDKNHLLR